MAVLELLIAKTATSVVNYVANRLSKWFQKKSGNEPEAKELEKLQEEIEELKKSTKKEKEMHEEVPETEVNKLRDTINKIDIIQKQNDMDLISNKDFGKWIMKVYKGGDMESEDLADIIRKELDLAIEKSREMGVSDIKRRELEDVAISLRLNVKYLKNERSKARQLGLSMDDEKVKNRERILEQSLYEARGLIDNIYNGSL